jgi:hypothetical protein
MTLAPFLIHSMASRARQQAFRCAVVAHLGLLAAAAWLLAMPEPRAAAPILGHLLLVAGIVEGAALVGWRLTQLPKSQALEFLLVSPLRPRQVFLAEALAGLGRLALVTLSGLPVLAVLTAAGCLDPVSLALLLVTPLTWGAVTGLALTVWAYEPRGVRRWGERAMVLLIVLYLAVGVLAAERLKDWLVWLPAAPRQWLLVAMLSAHHDNPFGLLADWLKGDPWVTWEWTLELEFGAVAVLLLLLARAAGRLHGHFQDLHYQVKKCREGADGTEAGGLSFSFVLVPFAFLDQPLAWWAVRRVTRYAGRINIWLAGGFGLLYALYTLAGPSWPGWLGREVFLIVDRTGGIPALTTALVLLAAVPAAFQYGLWDSSAQGRCRRLELLLLTQLHGRDYWNAAGAAAWRRGRAYFAVALVLWAAAAASGRMSLPQVLGAAATGVLLWGLYFAMGFRAFARGVQASGLGTLLTLGLPLAAFGLCRVGGPMLAALLPPGGVYSAGASPPALAALPGPIMTAGLTLALAQRGLRRCDADLRYWYALHHGSKVMD